MMAKEKDIEVKLLSYNPLKMWGSWVGGISGLIFGLINPSKIYYKCGVEFNCPMQSFYYLPILIFLFVLGFLIGWGIHSLIRKLRSKR